MYLDEVHDRIESQTLSIAPVDRDKLRRFYEGMTLFFSLSLSHTNLSNFGSILIQFNIYFI